MKLEEKRLLDLAYSFLGVLWYYFMKLFKLLNVNLNINKSENTTTKSDIVKGIKYNRKITYFDVDLSSSGTTGTPSTVYASPAHWISEQASQYQYFKENGYRFRDRMVLVRSYSPKKGEKFFKIDKIRNFVFISPFHLTNENISIISKFLKGRYFLRGYPSSLEILSKLFDEPYNIDPPVAIFTASETLTSFQRSIIEKKLMSRIYDWYGTSEPSVLLFQTKKSYPTYKTPNYHCDVKILKENKNKIIYGRANWDFLSGLGFFKTDDVVETDNNGNIIAIQGRKSDIITVENSSVPLTNFLTAFYSIPDILKFQIINYPDEVEFRFILNQTNDVLLKKIEAAINNRLPNIKYSINTTKKFKRSTGGKTPFFIKLS